MEKTILKNGIYPAMVTPFTADNKIDFEAVKRLTEWYIQAGCTGVFAACQSSEIYYLTLQERIDLVKCVVETAGDRLDVVACGAVAEDFDEMLKEAKIISTLGVKAVVLLTNHLAAKDEGDDILLQRLKKAEQVLDGDLGLYEIPVPYKRLLTPEHLKHCADSDRYIFLKDTCCNIEQIREKLQAVKGSRLKLFNANTETLLETVKDGACGISGIMSNYHPYLYVKMMEEYECGNIQRAEEIQHLLSSLSFACQCYPTSAKRHLMHCGVFTTDYSRTSPPLDYNLAIQIEHLYKFTQKIEQQYR